MASLALVLLVLVALAAVPVQAQTVPDSLGTADSLRAYVAAHPQAVEARAALAERLVADDDQPAAIRQYEAVVVRQPDHLEALRRLAQLYAWNERPEDVVATLERIVALDSLDLDARRRLGRQYFWTERPIEGIAQYEAVVRHAPDDLAARRLLAQHYGWNEMPERARKQYRAIVERDPLDVETTGRLAQQLVWQGELAEAVPLYRRVVAARPDSVEARLMLARTLLWTDRADAAVPHLREVLERDPDAVDALVLLGEHVRWHGDWVEARRLLRRARTLDPDHDRARELLAGLRSAYGPEVEPGYRRVEDSNRLVVERLPLAFTQHVDGRWSYTARAAWQRVADGRLNREVTSYDLAGGLQYRLSPTTTVRGELSAGLYSSDWTPVTLELRLSQSFGGRLFSSVRLVRGVARDGVEALRRQISTYDVAGEAYWQATRRLGVSSTARYRRYTDDNGRTTAAVFAGYDLLRGVPTVQLNLSYGYEDAETIYTQNPAYWTPDRLHTAAGRALVSHTFFGWLRLAGGYGATYQNGAGQQGVWAGNYRAEAGALDVRHHTLALEYEQSGSELYSAETVAVRYAYRF